MRKEKDIKITEENRDKGKLFRVTEMPAERAEDWALRLFLGLARSGFEIPDEVQQMGMRGLAVIGLKALGGLEYGDAKVLMDEMMECVSIVRDQQHPQSASPLLPEDIEEVSTRFELRKEVFELHTGFSTADDGQKSTSAPATSPSSATQTSPAS